MFTSKTYDVACPVCRKPHQIEAEFFSSPRSIIATDGRSLPSQSCGEHSADELQAAWRTLPDPDMNDSDMPIPLPDDYFKRCPVCGGLNPGDSTHTRCM